MQNIPSREGYCYVLFVINHAFKKSFVFPLTRSDSSSILLPHIRVWVNETFPSYGITLPYFYSDGVAESVSTDVLSILHSSGATTSNSPRDSPEMNFNTERWVRSLKEKVICMLLRSSLPVAFWWMAVYTACYLLINRFPTKTASGYTTPHECVLGVAPDLKWLRIWGCMYYVLKPIAERKKDFDDPPIRGFLLVTLLRTLVTWSLFQHWIELLRQTTTLLNRSVCR